MWDSWVKVTEAINQVKQHLDHLKVFDFGKKIVQDINLVSFI